MCTDLSRENKGNIYIEPKEFRACEKFQEVRYDDVTTDMLEPLRFAVCQSLNRLDLKDCQCDMNASQQD